MFSCMIDDKKDKDVATADITGYLLKTDKTRGSTHLKFDGLMANLLDRIDPYI